VIISLIAAASTNNVIGKNGQLPWSLPEDLKFFKNTTWAMPVVMGRKTFESLGNKPLPGRVNIVVTRRNNWKPDGAVAVNSLDDAIFIATENSYKEIFITGGGELFIEAITLADRIYLTRVHTEVEGDAFFPVIDESRWKLVSNKDCPADEKHAYAYSFQLWTKK